MSYAEEAQKHTGAKIGANAKKQMLAFVPHPSNIEFNGGKGKSFNYSHLYSVDFSLNYDQLVLTFSDHRITVTGRSLKSLLDPIEAFHCELVQQVDALQAAAGVGAVVTDLKLEDLEEEAAKLKEAARKSGG